MGIMSMSGTRVEMKLTQTNDIGTLMDTIANIDISKLINQILTILSDGYAQLFSAVKVAQLSLKHRMNKAQRQRIIAFVGHPMKETLEQCEDLGKRLKRNNVAIDVINFANNENVEKLTALVNAANNSSNSHFMDVPIGISMITDVLITSPILMGDDVDMSSGGGAGQPGQSAGGQFAEYGGINPDLEPELAMALKVSLEEEAARLKTTEPA